MTANGREEIVAVVSPRSVGGTSLFETTDSITKDNVQEFYSEDSVIQAACNALRQRGFRILQVSPTTISIAGSPDLFQNVFGVELQKRSKEVLPGQEQEFFSVVGESAQQVLQAPAELSNLIEGVTIPTPPTFFASPSPLPPLAQPHPQAYRYLFVPNEVALMSRAARVHRNGTTGKGIKVAMLDTGFYRHPFYNHYGFRVGATVLGPGASDPDQDTNGHGTGEAANIFANAPDAELIPVKWGSDIVGSFNAAVAQKPHVITNSWGFSVDTTSWDGLKQQDPNLYATLKALEAALADAVAKGIVVCFSAGNGHYGFPGSHPDVISVGGVHVNYPDLTLEASSYASSFDSKLYPGRHVPDVCGLVGKNTPVGAPSIMLPVQPGSNLDLSNTGATSDGWGLFSGTSAACPQVAGIVALLLQKDPTLTPAKVKEILKKSATDVQAGKSAMGDLAGPGPDAATGAGLADAKWAWINTMGDVLAQFLDAPPEKQMEMHEMGIIPKVKRDLVDDLITTLRSR
jgi:subtilase family serine protease